MGWVEDLTSGIDTATEVVESVGEFGQAVSTATSGGTRGYGNQPSGLTAVEAKEGQRLQGKISAGQGLTDWETKNVNLLTQKGYSFSYPMEFMGTGSNNVGIQQTGLFDQAIDAAVGAVTTDATNAVVNQAAGGLTNMLPWWKGPGGKLQMPWNDPQVAQYLKQFSLDDSYLRVYYRAPRGYVIVRDAQGRPYAVLRQIAKQFGLWHPAARPPISATDWKHYKRNKAIEKKLIKIARPALRAHSRPSAAKKGRK